MKYGLLVGALAMFVFAAGLDSSLFGGDKEKVTIKTVMKKAMGAGLCKKVASGKADEKEIAELVSLFTAMAKQEAPKGDADSWKKKTTALVEAAKAAKAGEANKALAAAADCKSCHSEHKGKK